MIVAREKRTLDWVQALRGIAALSVVLCHARFYFEGTPAWAWADKWMVSGAIGVDLFFILSGFIMVYSTANSSGSTSSVVDFFIKRFARIWPVYAVVTLAWVTMIGRGFGFIADPDKLAVLIRSLLFLPAQPDNPLYFGTALPVGWSLNYEVYFYLVFGVCLFFGKFRWAALVAWMLGTLVVLPLASGDASIDVWHPYQYSATYLRLMANPIICEFLCGVAIGLVYMTRKIKVTNEAALWVVVTASVGFALWYTLTYRGPIHGFFGWGWPVALMMLCLTVASKTVALRFPRPLIWLGEISYSLYLVHGFVNAIAHYGMDRLGMRDHVNLFAVAGVTTVLSIVLASLSHRYLEQGLSEAVRKWLLAKQWWGRAAASTPG